MSGWFGDWHPPPHRQLAFFLAGKDEIEGSDGEKRTFGSGDIVLFEDTTGVKVNNLKVVPIILDYQEGTKGKITKIEIPSTTDEKGPADLRNKSLMMAGDLIDFVSGGKTGRKKAKEIRSSAKTALDNAKSVIPKEKARGFNVAEAESLLSKAEQSYNSGDYTSAKSLAEQANIKVKEIWD